MVGKLVNLTSKPPLFQVPVEKGYVWFTVEETIMLPTTSSHAIGKGATQIQL